MSAMKSCLVLALALASITLMLGFAPADARSGSCPDISHYMETGNKLVTSAPMDAAKSYAEGVKLCPSSADLHYNLALAKLNQGDHRNAYNHSGKALKLAPGRMDLKRLHIYLLIAGNIDPARGRAMLETEIADHPEDELLAEIEVASLVEDMSPLVTSFRPIGSRPRTGANKTSPAVAGSSRFAVNSSRGTVIDHNTGLMWEYANDNRRYYFRKGFNYCDSLALDGFSDWSLPSKEQMSTLVVEGRRPRRGLPMFDASVFPQRPVKRYWISDKAVIDREMVMSYNMERAKTGEVSAGTRKHVWCVRKTGQ